MCFLLSLTRQHLSNSQYAMRKREREKWICWFNERAFTLSAEWKNIICDEQVFRWRKINMCSMQSWKFSFWWNENKIFLSFYLSFSYCLRLWHAHFLHSLQFYFIFVSSTKQPFKTYNAREWKTLGWTIFKFIHERVQRIAKFSGKKRFGDAKIKRRKMWKKFMLILVNVLCYDLIIAFIVK